MKEVAYAVRRAERISSSDGRMPSGTLNGWNSSRSGSPSGQYRSSVTVQSRRFVRLPHDRVGSRTPIGREVLAVPPPAEHQPHMERHGTPARSLACSSPSSLVWGTATAAGGIGGPAVGAMGETRYLTGTSLPSRVAMEGVHPW